MQASAIRVSTPAETTWSETANQKSPARRDSLPTWNRKCSSRAQTQEDSEPAPGSVRPLHRADVHSIEPTGSETWIDVRIHTAHVDQPIGRNLLRQEQQNCRAYGQTSGYDINRLDQGVIPAGAQALFQRLLHHRTQSLVRQRLGSALNGHTPGQLRAVGAIGVHPAPSSLAVSR